MHLCGRCGDLDRRLVCAGSAEATYECEAKCRKKEHRCASATSARESAAAITVVARVARRAHWRRIQLGVVLVDQWGDDTRVVDDANQLAIGVVLFDTCGPRHLTWQRDPACCAIAQFEACLRGECF